MTSPLKTVTAQRAIESGGRLRVQSALNPVLWLCGLITTPSVLVLAFSKAPPVWLIWLIIAPVAVAIFGFLFLLFFDRDKLQSEDYQLKKRSLELIEQKGMSGPIIDDAVAIVSPHDLPLIDKGEGQ